ncbi:MAG: PaaI family thioesterase [Acetobacteraceae bacterium]|nr:PaaI family thioesterase [Acetobacteraceae bacterium]
MAHLGTRLVRVEPGLCVLEQPFGPPVAQQQGLFHGGMIAAVVDVAGGYAALSMAEAGQEALTVEYKLSFLSPARGELLVATGRVLRAGRTLIVTRIDAEVLGDGQMKLCATALQTIMPVVPFADRSPA